MINTIQARRNLASMARITKTWATCRTGTNILRTAPIINGPPPDLNILRTISQAESIARIQGTETTETLWGTGQTRTRICSFRTRAPAWILEWEVASTTNLQSSASARTAEKMAARWLKIPWTKKWASSRSNSNTETTMTQWEDPPIIRVTAGPSSNNMIHMLTSRTKTPASTSKRQK